MKSLILRLLLITLSFSLYANAQNSTKKIPGPRPDPTRDASFLWMRDSERAARGLPLTDFDMRNRWRPTTPPTHAPGDVQPLQRSLGKRAEVSATYDAASGVPRHLFATKGRLSAPGTPSSDAVIGFLRSHPELFRMSDRDLNRFLSVRNYTDTHNGVTHVVFKQFANQIEVFQGDVTAAFDRDGALGNLAGSLHPGLQFPSLAHKIDAFEAVRRAAANVFPDLKYNPQYYTLPQTDDQLTEFEQGPFTSKPWARLVWFPIDGTARLAWRVRLNSARRLGWYDMLVDAVSGELLFRYNLFKSDQGLYFPTSPGAGPAQQISFNGDPIASPLTWVFGFSPQKTRGNNVLAGEDHDGDLENTSSFLSVNAGFPLLQDSHAVGGNFSVYTFKNTYLNAGSSQITTFDLANKRVRYAPNALTGGYDVTLSAAAFTAPGVTTLATISACDDCFQAVAPAGFSFNYYGTAFTTFFVSSNGLLTFAAGDADWFARTDKFRVTKAIAPLWDDFNPAGNPGNVFLDTFTEGTGTSLRITFSAIPELGTTNSSTFQITLHNHGAAAGLADVIDVDYQAVAASTGVLGISPGGTANSVLWLRDFSTDLPVTSLVSAGQGIAEPYPAPDLNVAIVNLFIQANLYHDRLYHLGFTEAAGNFQYDNFGRGGLGGDMVLAGAQAGISEGDLCNAFFATPEDGTPGFTMFFFFSQQFCGFRNVDGVLDATVVIHEFTHGLSNRLVGGPLNVTALAGYQGGALGEGWSDGYAAHFNNTPIMGVYATGNSTTGIRTVAYDNSPLTYAQFGNRVRLCSTPAACGLIGQAYVPEVHMDGEIWASVLWDLRTQLGGDTFIQLVTDAMKLTPPSPSMLDARNAIYVADVLDSGGAHIPTIGRVFAARGMGSSASIEPHVTGNSAATTVFAAFDNPKVDPVRRIVWQDRVESGMGGWTLDSNPNNLWHITTYRSADLSGGHSFYFGLESTHTYNNGSRVLGTLTSPPIALPRVLSNSNLVLEFDDFLATEVFSVFDSGYVRVSTDNFVTFTQVAWRNLNTIGVYTSSFAHQRINLAPFAGKTIQVQFYFDTLDSGANAFEGWYVDNVRVVMEGNDVRLMRNQPGRFFASSGASNFGVFRPSTGEWFINPSGLVTVFGANGDVPVPADYNHDGKSEITVFRPSTCQWFAYGVFVYPYGCGAQGDIPIPGDYVTNGTSSVAVYRQPTGEWFVPGLPTFVLSSAPDAIPVAGDFDGDGLADLAVVAHEPTDELTDNLTWTYRRSSDGVIVRTAFGSLLYGDIPVPADYNGDGKTEIAVFRPQTGQWFINGVGTFLYGAAGDIPVPGDYLGNGTARMAVYRPTGGAGHWFIHGVGDFFFGNSTDIPIGAQN